MRRPAAGPLGEEYLCLAAQQSWVFFVIFCNSWCTKSFQMCMLQVPLALTHPHTIRDAGFLTKCWQQAGWSVSSLFWRTRYPWFLKWNLPYLIPNGLWPREEGCFSGSCSHMTSLHDRALTCICGWHDELFTYTGVSGSVPERMQWFSWQNHVRIQCSAAWESKVHRHLILIFGHVPCAQRRLQIIWTFWWCYEL